MGQNYSQTAINVPSGFTCKKNHTCTCIYVNGINKVLYHRLILKIYLYPNKLNTFHRHRIHCPSNNFFLKSTQTNISNKKRILNTIYITEFQRQI